MCCDAILAVNHNTSGRKTFNYVRKQSFVSKVNNNWKVKKHLLPNVNTACVSIGEVKLSMA